MTFKIKIVTLFLLIYCNSFSQFGAIEGIVLANNVPLEMATIGLKQTKIYTISAKNGFYKLTSIPYGTYELRISISGYESQELKIKIDSETPISLNINLQEIVKDLNEVTIKAISKKLLDKENPIALHTISEKSIDRSSESNIIDVLSKNTPGLTSFKSGPNVSKPFIRGLGYNRVLTLYDGIRQEGQQWGEEHGIEVDAYDIQRAEVIKGPASLMYGTDALAGVVSLFPFKPKQENGFTGRYVTEFQSNNLQIGNGLRLSYVKNSWSMGLRTSWRFSSNYQNSIDGKVYNSNFNEKNGSGYLAYTSEKAIISFNVSIYDNLQGIPDGSRDSLTRKFTKQIYNSLDDELETRPIVSDEELNSFKIAPIYQHIQHYRLYSNGDFKLKNSSLDYSLGFQQNRRREYNQPENPELTGLALHLNTINYHLKYSLPVYKKLESYIGANGVFQINQNQISTSFTIPDYTLFDGGIFTYFKWKNEKISICGGLRSDIRTINFDDFYLVTDTLTGFDSQVQGIDTSGATLQFPSYSKLFHGISASVGLSYFISKNWTLKMNIGRGFRAPNITEIASNGLDPGARLIYLGNRNFKPEFSLQQDLALLFNFRNISGEISLFNNHIQQFIYLALVADSNGNPIVDSQGNRTYQYQQSNAQLFGLETSISYHPEKLKNLDFTASFSFVNGFNREEKYRNKKIEGEYLSLIPPARLTSAISYQFNIKPTFINSIKPTVEFEYNAQQNKYLAINNTETETPAYGLLNFQLALDWDYLKSKTGIFIFQVNNIFDIAYQSHLSRLKYFENYQASSSGKTGIFSMGRNICLKIILPF